MKTRRIHPLAALALAGALATLPSCASALKKKCEATNWFEHGENIAKSGEKVSSDPFIQQCEKEEAAIDHAAVSQGFRKGILEYCTPEFAYRVGRRGDFLVTDACASQDERAMKVRHLEGVREYCQPSNGAAAGGTGRKYNQVCPRELERAFLPEFNKGRKRYLETVIGQKEGEIRELDAEIGRLERRRSDTSLEIQQLDRTRIVPPAQAATLDAQAQEHNRRVDSQIQSLRWDARRWDQEIDRQREQQRALRKEIQEAQAELPTL